MNPFNDTEPPEPGGWIGKVAFIAAMASAAVALYIIHTIATTISNWFGF